MTENYDVASRLAQGRPAVDTVAQYVWASHQVGYHHQDLTTHPAQVRDWYGTEDGMDLGALQRGWSALDAAMRAVDEALGVQDRQLAQLSAVWHGAGGQAAQDFLRRHSDASAAVAAAVRTAAEAVATLRDDLWQAVSSKVDTAVAIEARAEGARAEWLAAATTVTTGAGDRAAASELVDTAVKPFVDNDIGGEWLVAMRSAVATVTAAYERAVDEIDGEPSPVFDIPGDFGPACRGGETATAPACADPVPDCPSPVAASAPVAAPTAPSAWSAPVAPAPAPAAASASPLQSPPPLPPVPPAPPAPTAPPPLGEPAASPLGAMGSAMPGMGGGLSGLGQQFADTLSGLLGGAGGGLLGGAEGGIPELPDTELDEPVFDDEPVEPEEEEDVEEDPEDVAVEEEEAVEEAGVDTVVAEGSVVAEEVPEQDLCEPTEPGGPAATPAPSPAPPPAEPLPPPAAPVAAEPTPCEIAADEVPQVGEPPE